MAHPNQKIIEAAWRAIAEGDIEALRHYVAPDARWVATGGVPWAGEHQGFDAIVDLLAHVGEELDSFDASIVEAMASDDRVVLIYHTSASLGQRILDCDYVLVGTLENGLIQHVLNCPLDPPAVERFWSTGLPPQFSVRTH